MKAETEQERIKRRRQRTVFDGVAGLYQASRPGWPDDARRAFNEELRHQLLSQAEVHLTLRATVTMAPVLR
jgi:hypothetical protein